MPQEELKLEQCKKKLCLQGEIDAAEAKREVYKAEELSGFQYHSSSVKTMPVAQLNITPMNELTKDNKPKWITDKTAPNSTLVPCHNKSNGVNDELLR